MFIIYFIVTIFCYRTNYIHFHILKDMKQHSEIIDIIYEKANKFEQLNIVICKFF